MLQKKADQRAARWLNLWPWLRFDAVLIKSPGGVFCWGGLAWESLVKRFVPRDRWFNDSNFRVSGFSALWKDRYTFVLYLNSSQAPWLISNNDWDIRNEITILIEFYLRPSENFHELDVDLMKNLKCWIFYFSIYHSLLTGVRLKWGEEEDPCPCMKVNRNQNHQRHFYIKAAYNAFLLKNHG